MKNISENLMSIWIFSHGIVLNNIPIYNTIADAHPE